jgi:protocatechuate 3,4-dioxygenase beta subunit
METKGRREVLKALSALGTLAVFRCGGTAAANGGGVSNGACVLDPTLTRGPFWIDERLQRSDVRSDANGRASPNPRPGLPLALRFAVSSFGASTCAPLAGAQVDIWHCDAAGIYSDVQGTTAGQNFLRGYQTTDATGAASFTTIYPGWYSGRAVHIHVKVRVFDSANNATTEATTQIFFDDAVSDSVYRTASPYSSRPARNTRNAADGIYNNQTVLLASLQGDATTGYSATFPLAVRLGQVNAG